METAGLDPEEARVRASSRRASKRALWVAAAALPLAVLVGVGLAWRLSWEHTQGDTRKVQAYYDHTAVGTARVSGCFGDMDAERSIFLRVCRVSSANREVFHLTPAPVVAERSAYLCFDVAHDVDLFGFRQSRSPHLCVLAAGDGPFYRR